MITLIKNRSGQSLVELVIYAALAAIFSLFVSSLISNLNRGQKKIIIAAKFLEKKNQIQEILYKEQTFKNTRAAVENAGMQCLRDKVPCEARYVSNSGYIPYLEEIVLYDGSPAPGRIFHDGRSSSNKGFTENGAECVGFSAFGTGNDSCPSGYIIYWSVDRPSGTMGINLTITAKLIYNPSPGNNLRELYFTSMFGPNRFYDATVTKVVQSVADLNVISCNQSGIQIFHQGNYTFYRNVAEATGTLCQSEQRICTVANDIPRLSGSFINLNCAQNCSGQWGACSTSCGPGTITYSHTIPAEGGGVACAIANGTSQACNMGACCDPRNGTMGTITGPQTVTGGQIVFEPVWCCAGRLPYPSVCGATTGTAVGTTVYQSLVSYFQPDPMVDNWTVTCNTTWNCRYDCAGNCNH